jgi:hypothetical protein
MGRINASLSDGHAAIDAAKGIGDGDRRSRVGDPLAIHHEEVFVDARLHLQGFGPTPLAQRDHGCGRWMPIVERPCDRYHAGFGIVEVERHRAVIRERGFVRGEAFGGGLGFHGWYGTDTIVRWHRALWLRIACSGRSQFCGSVAAYRCRGRDCKIGVTPCKWRRAARKGLSPDFGMTTRYRQKW